MKSSTEWLSVVPPARVGQSQSISVVIPTVGRSSLFDAVCSALRQSVPVSEVVVVADTSGPLPLPVDARIRVVRTGPAAGGNAARQAGIEAARGPLIALLDDDDVWEPGKIAAQLALLNPCSGSGTPWIIACSVLAVWPDGHHEQWPHRVIASNEDIAEYMFGRHRLRHGHGFLQASGLVFARELALEVPFRRDLKFHQDVTWLLDVSAIHPGVRVIQSPEPLVRYTVGPNSVSTTIRSEQSVRWAREFLAGRSSRAIGDFLATLPVYYARRERSLSKAWGAVRAAFTEGRPSLRASAYAIGSIAVISVETAIARPRHLFVRWVR